MVSLRCKIQPLWSALIGHREPTTWPANALADRSPVQWRPYLFTLFVLFFEDCDSSSGISNLRHTYGPPDIRLKMNTFCFKQIDGLLAKFLAL